MKLASLLLAALLALTACSSQTEEPTPDPIEEPTPEPAPEPEENPNLVENGAFEGEDAWAFFFYETAEGNAAVREGELCFDISNGGGALWNVQVVQSELGLQMGKTYTTRFDAYASEPLQVRAALEEDGDDYTFLAGEVFDLTDAKASYEFTAPIEEDIQPNRINLSTGGALVGTVPVTMCLDNIEVREVAPETDE